MDPSLLKIGGVTTPATLGGGSIYATPTNNPLLSFGISAPEAKTTEPVTPGAAPKTTSATAPVDQSGYTPSGLFINSDGTVNLEKSLASAKKALTDIQAKAASLAQSQQPTTPTTSFVSSSDSAVANENNVTSTVKGLSVPDPNIQGAQNASDAYMKVLDDQMAALEARRKAEVDSINASFDATQVKTEDAQKRETGTTNVAVMRAGGYLGTQISAVGVLNNLAQTHRQEIAALQAKRAAAIQEANNAITDKEFAIAQSKATEVKNLDKEINDRRNKFFDQSMKIVEEQRLQATAEETRQKNALQRSIDTADQIAPTLANDIQSMDAETARNYLAGAAKDLQLDPNILIGSVNKIISDQQQKEQQQVYALGNKYPSAGITPEDSYATAAEKVRNSKEYKLDISKAEADLSNTRSLISSRASDASIDYSSPIFKLYTQATGEVISSPTKARAVQGYADSLLAGKEVVANDFKGTLADNQIRASDAQQLVTSAFANLKDSTISDEKVWQWLSTPEAQGLSDEEKKSELMSNGKNPSDFGIY